MGGPSPSPGVQHAGHTPTTASCPTPARRRHRTTFTQVSLSHENRPTYFECKFSYKCFTYYRKFEFWLGFFRMFLNNQISF